MRLKERIVRRLVPRPKNDIYYHEAGHVVIAKIFDKALKVEFVTANADESQTHDLESMAGTLIKFRKPDAIQVGDVDAMILSILASIVSDEINNTDGRESY